MKKIVGLLFATLLVAAACANKTEYGSCVGITDDHDPRLIYKTSTRNVVIGAIFIETVVVPLVVVCKEISCPVARR